MTTFEGYPATFSTFFAGLTENMDREWFEAHKSEYLDDVLEPTKLMVVALGERMQSVLPSLEYDPDKSLMRIYRDLRFSQDKSPYKTYQGITFWIGDRPKKKENPGFHVAVSAEGVSMHGGIYDFDKPLITAYREAVADDVRGTQLVEILANLDDAYELGGEKGKRVPRGYAADHPRADLLLYKGLHANAPIITPDVAASPQFLEVAMRHVEHLAPLVQWIADVDKTATE